MITRHSGLPRLIEAPFAVAVLLVTLPILAVVSALVLLTSKGHPIFRQTRVGRYGKPFTLLKIRTMVPSSAGLQVTTATDSRITPVGTVLRRYKIDELPSLWNVIVGDMSFVGPRPEVPAMVDLSRETWQAVLRARPGLTDPTTLRFKNEEQMLARVQGDTEEYYRREVQPVKLKGYVTYLDHRTPWTDLSVLWRTLVAILRQSSDQPRKARGRQDRTSTAPPPSTPESVTDGPHGRDDQPGSS